MPEANKKVLELANAAITKGDYEGFLAFCTDDTTWSFEGAQTLKGKEAVRQWMATAYTTPPNFKVEHLISDRHFVVAIGEILLPSDKGEAVRHSYCDVWQFRDGKMAGLRAFVVPVD